MISELTVQHAYIQGGDLGFPGRPSVALPGARFEFDAKSGRYRIAKIFAGDNAEDRYRSPLTEVGVDVRVGDYVLAINGRELRAGTDPYELLASPTGQPVGWRVERLGGGRLGYIHIPDMEADGIREFIKWWYPQMRKEGLVVDVRDNGGGNISELLISRLAATLHGTRYVRNQSLVGTYPRAVMTGPKVALVNEETASDGDIFSHQFRQWKIGPLIGKRTWGGVIGIEDHGPLLDGGTVFVPEFGTADEKGRWIIEGHGVDLDIVVEQDPVAVTNGHDPQLERAIEELLRMLPNTQAGLPPRPAPPVKTEAH